MAGKNGKDHRGGGDCPKCKLEIRSAVHLGEND